jgi:hypothetical protein
MNDPLIEYIKLHIISLEQDMDNKPLTDKKFYQAIGAIDVLNHILDVAQELDEQSLYMIG